MKKHLSYCIACPSKLITSDSDGHCQYLAGIVARISGKNGGRIHQSFADQIHDRRSPPLMFAKLSEAQAMLDFLKTQLPDTTSEYEVVEVTFYKNKPASVVVKRLEGGLTIQEKGSLT